MNMGCFSNVYACTTTTFEIDLFSPSNIKVFILME